ncbi:MAG: hypothetical protein KC656_38225, partial [Myxococcales bacterium]|nr:hypothetical protein [Myxococcales bacterium]
AERVHERAAVGPGDGAVDRRLGHVVAAVVHERLPGDVAAGGDARVALAEDRLGVEALPGLPGVTLE